MRKLTHVAERLSTVENLEAIYDAFQDVFEEWPSKELKDLDEFRSALLFNIYGKLDPAEFLFSKDVYGDILVMQARLLLLICTMRDDTLNISKINERKIAFCKSAERIKTEDTLGKMDKDLQLQSIKL